MIFEKLLKKEISDLKNLLNKLEYTNLENLDLLFRYSIKAIKKIKNNFFEMVALQTSTPCNRTYCGSEKKEKQSQHSTYN